MTPTANTEGARFWSERAPTWLRFEAQLTELTNQPGVLAMERLDPRPGHRVLDVGCGSGGTTLDLAAKVSPDGSALGLDIAPELLAGADERAEARGLDNVKFLAADAQVYDFEAAQFDRVYSRFGVMFFGDPGAAFSNLRRAMRNNGLLSFASWQNMFANEWMLVPGMAAMAALGVAPTPPAPGAPGPFGLSDPDLVRSVLSEAGFHDVQIEPHNDAVTIPESAIHERAVVSSHVGLIEELLRDADDATRSRVLAAIEEAFRGRLDHGEVHIARGWLVVTALA